MFQIKSQPGVAYKMFIKKTYNIVFYSFKNEEKTLSHEFIFVFIWYYTAAILSEKSCQKWGFRKNIKKGESWPYRGVVYRRGRVSNLLHSMIDKV